MDSYDWKILKLIQINANLTNQEIGNIIGLSPSQCSRRKKNLEDLGIIEGYCARINNESTGFNIRATLHVSLKNHDEKSKESFKKFIDIDSNIQDAYSISGDSDFMLTVIVENLDKLYKFITNNLLSIECISQVKTYVILKKHKEFHKVY